MKNADRDRSVILVMGTVSTQGRSFMRCWCIEESTIVASLPARYHLEIMMVRVLKYQKEL